MAAPRPRGGRRLATILAVTAVVVAGGTAAGLALAGGDDDPDGPVPTSPAVTSDVPSAAAITGDVTGDGKGDVVMTQSRSDSGNPVSILTLPSTGLSLGAAEATPLAERGVLHVADVDGDGLADLVTDEGNFVEDTTTVTVRPGDGSDAWQQVLPTPASTYGSTSFGFLADADGDGRDDVVLTASTDGRTGLYVALAGDRELGELQQWYAGSEDWTAAEFFSGDYDGDGRSDLLVVTSVDNGSGGELWTVYSSDGTALTPGAGYPVPPGGPAVGTPLAGDVDGDGADEVVLLGGAGKAVTVFEVEAGEVAGKKVWARGLDGGGEATFAPTFDVYTVSDLDGDGDDDLVWLQPDRTFAALVSDGSAFADPQPWGTLDCGDECQDRFSFADLD